MTAPVERFDVVVVGGGQASLAAAWHLRRQGLQFLVLEAAGELGHTWRTRWKSLRLFTPAEQDALPGLPFPAPAGTYPAHVARTVAAVNSGQVPRPRGAPDAQAAPRHVRK